MKTRPFSNGLAVVSLITAGLALTSAKPQAHGHQHADIFGRILHKSKASSGSSLGTSLLGATDSRTIRSARSGVAVLIYSPESVTLLPTATGAGREPDCFGEDCSSTNATQPSNPFTHPTPGPQIQLQAFGVQDGQLAGLSSRRRNRYRSSQTSENDEASPTTEIRPASTGTMFEGTIGKC